MAAAMTEFFMSPENAIPATATGLIFAAFLFELILTKGRSYGVRDTLANFAMYLGYVAIGLFWIPVVYSIFVFVHDHSLFKIGDGWQLGQASWSAWLLLFIADDFCYYWFHRVSHSWFWFAHVTHHSSAHFNLSVGFRQTWLPFYAFVFWLPLAFIGFDPLMILTMQLLSLAVQGLLHTEAVRSLGPLEFVFNSPSHHRVHHGSQELYRDRNFGGVLILWDRLFGTFQKEEEPPIYGTGEPVSYNPLKIAFGELLRRKS